MMYLASVGDENKYDDYKVVPRHKTLSRKAISRYDQIPRPLNVGDYNVYAKASMHLRDEFSCMMNSRMMTYDEVLDKLDSSKSPGYPWTLKYRYKYDYWLSDEHKFFDKYFESLGTDSPINTLASITIKEELRETSKVNDGNIRTIATVDVNHLVAHSILMMDQNDKLTANHLKCSSGLGLSLMYGGAQRLYEYLTPWGDVPCIMSIDGKKFDSTYHDQASELIYDFRYDCLATTYKNDTTRKKFENIRKQIWNVFLVDIDGAVYMKATGNLSGQGSTTPDNILKNWLDFFFLWLLCVPEQFKNYASFKKFTRCLFVGDDAIIAVHPDFQQYFNKASINEHAHRMNMKYEFESDNFERFCNVSFIGHKFLYKKIPNTQYKMYLPHIDCNKMRTSLVRFNTTKDLHQSIVRCNGLRAETFACESCRVWFSDIYIYLKQMLSVPYTHASLTAISTYFSDDQLWELYTNLTLADIYCLKQAHPANKIQTYPYTPQSLRIMPNTKKQKKKNKTARFTKSEIATFKKNLGFKRMNLKATTNSGTRISGRGDYSIRKFADTVTKPFYDDTKSVGMVNKISRSLGRVIGGTVLPGMGNEIGNATSWLARAFGFGDYAVKTNSLMSNNIAQFANRGAIEFSHREFITDVSATTSFTNNSYLINPGNAVLFPWLSTIAKNFEQYEMLGLIFEFKSMSATSSITANSNVGTLIMATDYDVLDGPYQDKRAMEVTDFATSGAIYNNQIHPIECDPKQNVMSKLFIQPGNSVVSYPDDARFSALGNFQIATSGVPTSNVVGELWVSYHVRLLKPQLELGTTSSSAMLHANITIASGVASISRIQHTEPSALGVTTTNGAVTLHCLNTAGIGTFLISYTSVDAITSGVATVAPAVTWAVTTGGATIVPMSANPLGVMDVSNTARYGTASAESNNLATQGYNTSAQTFIVQFTAVNGSVDIPNYHLAASNKYYDLYVTPYTQQFVACILPKDEVVTYKTKSDVVNEHIRTTKPENESEDDGHIVDKISSEEYAKFMEYKKKFSFGCAG